MKFTLCMLDTISIDFLDKFQQLELSILLLIFDFGKSRWFSEPIPGDVQIGI